MLDIFIASTLKDIENEKLPVRLSLGGALYWYLHRYFVHADLEPGSYSFLNLYEDTELSGYQLHRLKVELEQALIDLAAQPSVFKVLVGWSGTTKSFEAEERKDVDKNEAQETINRFLALIREAQHEGKSLWAIGD